MVTVSLFLALALVSSTVVAQPGTNGLASLFACFKQQTTSEISTKSVYEWIPPSKTAPAPTSNRNSLKIGLKYILQKLNLRSNQFKRRTSFTDHFGVTHLYGIPLHEGLLVGNLHAAVHVKDGQAFFYSATIIVDDQVLIKRSPTTPESMVEKSSEEALRDNPVTQWFEVRVDANTGVVVSKESFKRGFTYKAVNLPNESPNDGFSTIVDPENIQSSPKGWTEVANMLHDITYQYGFTEKAGNFQKNNFNKGGKGKDPVIIDIQSSKETDSAEFSTPLDGYPGVLTLYIYTATEPNRDPALDNTILIHELTHGLSDRLTGGAQTKICMTDTESLGLSEGYSDIVAMILTAKPEDTRNTIKVIGEYVEGDSRGIRDYPYTTDMRFNPLAYKDASKGNIIFLQLLVGTLMIQPCDPTFISARDAMLATDHAYYGGVHEHLIRQGFAKRGLGSIS
ncbi:hypothetical protein BASA60_000468 [Batrachochytrium salamandrivorans]|nr:hypothetical protein BASA60_000468 [Batrachochytrium salamandrivorans]